MRCVVVNFVLVLATQAMTVPDRLIAEPSIPTLTNNLLLETTVRPFSAAMPTFGLIASETTEQQSVTIAALTSTVRPKLIPLSRVGGDAPRNTAPVAGEDYENKMKETYDSGSDYKDYA